MYYFIKLIIFKVGRNFRYDLLWVFVILRFFCVVILNKIIVFLFKCFEGMVFVFWEFGVDGVCGI